MVIGTDEYDLDRDNDGIACEGDEDGSGGTGGDGHGGRGGLVRTGESPQRLATFAVTVIVFGMALLVGGTTLRRRWPRIH